jgi:primosomal protein N' (replication factor Y)
MGIFLGNRILGPQYPYVARVKDQYRKELLIKIERKASITKTKVRIKEVLNQFSSEKEFKSIRIIVDVDPQ